MLLHQFGQHLVFLRELGFELFDLPVSSSGLRLARRRQGRCAVLEEQLLPFVKDIRMQVQLVAQIGNRRLLDQMPL